MSVKLLLNNSDELRDALPSSGVFDMFDCVVNIDCPEYATTSEVKKLTAILESVINVVDVVVTTNPRLTEFDLYIAEVPLHVAENRKPKLPPTKKGTATD